MSISRRVSIRWVSATQSTLATTTERNGHGAFDESIADLDVSTLVLTSPNGYFVDLRVAGNSHLDWGFVGRVTKHSDTGMWEHWVDSKTDAPAPDQGTFETLPNGDTLERGVMADDEGVIRPYEEVWADLAVEPDVSTVRVCRGADGAVMGMIARVGSWCQGLLKVKGRTTAERWRLENGHWELVFSTGEAQLPCRRVVDGLDSEPWTCIDNS